MKADPRLHHLTPLRQTPFHPRIAALNRHQQWGAWAGCLAALNLGDAEMEYTAIRNGASLYDLCPMIKYRFSGPDAAACLDRLTLRNVSKMPIDSVHYTAWCDDAGKVMDDGTLFRLGPNEFMLCCQERHLPWLQDAGWGFDVTVQEITETVAALSLQGPCTASVLQALGCDIGNLKLFRIARFPFAGGSLMVSRTGFTGDLGYELWVAPELALPLWDALMIAGAPWGIRPIGTEALDIARIEAGFILPNADFVPAEQALREDRVRSPFEVGLDWLIDWHEGHFNGRRALLAEKESNSSVWAMVGLDIAGNISTAGSLIYHAKTFEVGYITAAAWSPATKRNLAIAQVKRPYDTIYNNKLWVEVYALRELQYVKIMLQATVTPRPFLTLARRKVTPPGAH